MFELRQARGFKKDLKLAKKRSLQIQLLDEVVTELITTDTLPIRYKPHKLKGKYTGLWEYHIQPDWLLIWDRTDAIQLI